MFQYKSSVTATTKDNVSSAFMALKDACRLPDGSKYIVAIDGGVNNSPEGMTKGMEVRPRLIPLVFDSDVSQHAYVVSFRNAAERDYYLDTDPAHQAFKASIPEKIVDAVVFDFESGQFARAASARKRRPSDEIHVRTV